MLIAPPHGLLRGKLARSSRRTRAPAAAPSTSAGYGPMHLTDVITANTGGTHEEVLEAGRQAAERVQRLFTALLADERLY